MGMMLHRHMEDNAKEPHTPVPDLTHSINPLNRKLVRGRKRKAVVYAGTRNLYKEMVNAAKSLLRYNPNFQVYFLIEDDKFPIPIPDCIETINVSKQQWIRENSPNYGNHWSYMVLLRPAYTKIFPEYDKILSLDVDTVVMEDISCLWDIDMEGKYIAAVPEYMVRHNIPNYFNMGVSFHHLAEIRKDGLDDKIIDLLNKGFYQYPEQDVMNDLMRWKKVILPTRYNDSFCCGTSNNPAIVHLAGGLKSRNPRKHLQDDYAAVPWEDILKKRR